MVRWEDRRYLLHRFGLGERVIPCSNIREHHESSAGGRKENNTARGVSGGGKERCGERRVHKCLGIDLTPLPLKRGRGDDFNASRCRPTLRVFTVSWRVCNMLGPPDRT